MNRVLDIGEPNLNHLPHARGDEPLRWILAKRCMKHLPHARGDEPEHGGFKATREHLPHARGDEPL